jgi:microcystin-dependent protein
VDSDTQVTLSHTPTVSGVKSLTFFPHGAGNGSTTFNVPDFIARTAIGRKTADPTMAGIGQKVGTEFAYLTTNQMPAHTHYENVGSVTVGNGSGNNLTTGTDVEVSTPSGDTGSAGGADALSMMQPSLVVRKIIKF